MNTTPDWERASEREIGKRLRPSILGGRDYSLNAVIEYLPFVSTLTHALRRRVRITGFEACGKNNCPTFTGELIESHGLGIKLGSNPDQSYTGLGMAVWGYDDQITRIISTGDRCENREVSDGAW